MFFRSKEIEALKKFSPKTAKQIVAQYKIEDAKAQAQYYINKHPNRARVENGMVPVIFQHRNHFGFRFDKDGVKVGDKTMLDMGGSKEVPVKIVWVWDGKEFKK